MAGRLAPANETPSLPTGNAPYRSRHIVMMCKVYGKLCDSTTKQKISSCMSTSEDSNMVLQRSGVGDVELPIPKFWWRSICAKTI